MSFIFRLSYSGRMSYVVHHKLCDKPTVVPCTNYIIQPPPLNNDQAMRNLTSWENVEISLPLLNVIPSCVSPADLSVSGQCDQCVASQGERDKHHLHTIEISSLTALSGPHTTAKCLHAVMGVKLGIIIIIKEGSC